MRILIDTNILLRAAQPSHPLHRSAVRAMEILMEREDPLVVTVQNIAEFWNAATRPAANDGLGFTIEEAQEEL
jgi:predicted nucleic acid-binding protein